VVNRFFLLILLTSILSCEVTGQVIEVGIHTSNQSAAYVFVPQTSGYQVIADGVNLGSLQRLSKVPCVRRGGKILLPSITGEVRSYKSVEFKSAEAGQVFRLISADGVDLGTYPDHLRVNIHASHLLLINRLNIENYVAGVVEAESGKERHIEYYKVQSIISRTYALANFRRHVAEGYQLCDQVHCQVFHGKSRFEPLIPRAVMGTKGIVLVDDEIALITAAFSSNCGGKTRNSEEVWSFPSSYLKSIVDTFCLNSDHARWKRTIHKSEWIAFQNQISSAPNPHGKGSFIADAISEIAYNKDDLNAIRRHFGLNSTRFIIEEKQDSIVFTGRGFGHGVGLCQEGAMQMAEKGYSFTEMLEFYYSNIHLIELSNLGFFKSD
jgi:stage II sporulation protein D